MDRKEFAERYRRGETPSVSEYVERHPELAEDLRALLPPVAQMEQQYLRRALKKTRGHVGRCARICGLSRRSITSKIAEYGIKKEELREL